MSDFPHGGDLTTTRAWLDNEGFDDVFQGNIWKADALLGKDDAFIKSKFLSTEAQQERGEVLCGLLNTARKSKGNFIIFISSSVVILLSIVLYITLLNYLVRPL